MKEEEKKIWVAKFNDWRKNYDTVSYNDNRLFHSQLFQAFPEQSRAKDTSILMKEFLANNQDKSFKVFELGGWDGGLAKSVLGEFANISVWNNIELCDDCVKGRVCLDQRYKVSVLNDYLWNLPLMDGYDILVASHIFEHIKAKDLTSFLTMYSYIPILFCEVPILEKVNWHDYYGTHILEWTMTQFKQFVEGLGYKFEKQLKFAMLFKK